MRDPLTSRGRRRAEMATAVAGLAAALGLMLPASAVAQPLPQSLPGLSSMVAPKDPNNCNDWKPPGVRITHCWKVSTKVETGRGHNTACILLDENPYGAYTEYTIYYGWSFLDANGQLYTDRNDTNNTPAPWAIVGTRKTIECRVK
jgi:hypothetical protein